MKKLKYLIVAIIAALVSLFAWAITAIQNASVNTAPARGREWFQRKLALLPLAFLRFRRLEVGRLQFANIGEGVSDTGAKMFIPDAVTTSRYLLYKKGSDVDHVAITTTGETPIGSSDDQVDDITVPISINVFGAVKGTVRVVTDGTVADGNYVKCGTTGRVTVAVTTDVVIGKALIGTDATSAAGDVISIIPIMPGKHPF